MKIQDLENEENLFKTASEQSQIDTDFPFIIQTWPQFLDAVKKPSGVRNTVLEKEHQRKILSFLEQEGFETIKVVTANKAANADILACSPCGQFWKIEVKREKGTLTSMQRRKLVNFWKRHSVGLAVYGFDDFMRKYLLLLKRAGVRTR